jgi:hypothetical protein
VVHLKIGVETDLVTAITNPLYLDAVRVTWVFANEIRDMIYRRDRNIIGER